ncbi:SRPBCC family protein [Nocardia huaxiensis]|uniref:SRPBCC family protein n=1 Tax=Nocardia huaxiensis TaxID=2755382 RepID=A0A7D6VAJ1_9NOCA|nr:SRPBCC family protein [Nocardia huaxiensis]QLY31832.1 SRPBCC family protein [Nocardia huaxiensis]UFS95396.1 SRPBCC family protein [Nocardia huaxiensis]
MSNPETTYTAEPNSHVATVSAVIDAPKAAVYRAHTEIDLYLRWWGPRELTSKVEKFEPFTGGSWRITHVDPEGNEYGFRGVYHEVSADRIVHTFEFDGTPGHVSLETITFEEVDGKTKVTTLSVFQSVADRDGMAQSGMEEFAPIGMAQLQEVAASL